REMRVHPARLTRLLTIHKGLLDIGETKAGGIGPMLFYDRAEALAWISNLPAPADPYKGEIVPPREPAPFRPIRLSAGLQSNFARAGEVYPHTFITPKGLGNDVAYQRGFGEK